jgi:hypothetical protein
MLDVIFNHPELTPAQAFGAIYFGTLSGSLRDPLVLVAYAVVVLMSFRKFRAVWIGAFIFTILALRLLTSLQWSISAGLADGSFADRIFTNALVFSQIALAGVFARMLGSIEIAKKPK